MTELNLQQRGVALITAILIVSICSILAVSMMFRTELDIRRAQNLISGDQAYLYTLGAESLAKVMLSRDKKQGTIDHLQEPWALPIVGLPIEQGMISGTLTDQQGLFNVNNLVESGGVSLVDVQQFSRLLQLLGLSPTLAQGVVDWIDTDFTATIPSGAEDDFYLLDSKMPYRTPNRALKSVSELLLIKGFDAEIMAKLEPYICALPSRTTINVNTAPALVLASLSPKVTLAVGENLVAHRIKNPFDDISAFLAEAKLAPTDVDAAKLSFSTNYFLLRARASFDRSTARLVSLIHRKSASDFDVVMRSRGAI